MNITRRARLTAAFVLISSLFIHAAKADIYWETETTMTNVRHNSNGSSIQKYYLTTTASRLELADKKVFILNHNTMKLYALDPKKQKFSVLDLNKLPGFPARMLAALVGLRVTRTGELKTISGYRCHGWHVHLAILNGECWVSDEVEGFGEFRILGEKVGAAVERSPLFSRIDITGAFDRVGGFPVYAVYHVMGGTVAIKLIKVEQKSLDPSLFVVPKDYSPGKVRLAGYNRVDPGPIHAMAIHELDQVIKGSERLQPIGNGLSENIDLLQQFYHLLPRKNADSLMKEMGGRWNMRWDELVMFSDASMSRFSLSCPDANL